MMASELVDELRKLIARNGDHEVKVYSYACAGHYDCGDPYAGVDEVLIHDDAAGKRAIRIETAL